MRTKSLIAPTGVEPGHEWLSPDGHSQTWHRKFDGFAWKDVEASELEEEGDLEEEDTEEDEQPHTEDSEDEQGMQAAVSDSDGGKQGASGGSGSEPKQRRQRGKVRKGGKGK